MYLLYQPMSGVNSHSEIAEDWVIVDLREVQGFLVIGRPSISAGGLKGPWWGPYHARDMAINNWLSKPWSSVSPGRANLALRLQPGSKITTRSSR